MPSADAFFHALQQDPHDDALRLVYADFLEDHGDDAAAARAELMRLQVALANLSPRDPRSVEMAARQDELIACWEHHWLGEWGDVLDGWTFRRGLVEAVRTDASVFLEHAEEWFAEWPTLAVAKLTRAGGHVEELAASSWLAHLRGLDLSDNGLDPTTLAHLMSSRYVSLLQALDLSDNPLGPTGAEALAFARSADELRELHLARCELWGRGLEALLGGGLRNVRRLDLSDNRLCRRDVVGLVNSGMGRGLTSLDLSSNPLGYDGDGVSALADSPSAAGLVDLGLSGIWMGDAALSALAGSPHLGCLRSLDLRGHGCSCQIARDEVERSGIAALARSPLLGQLTRLFVMTPAGRNGWAADVMSAVRPPRRPVVYRGEWVANLLRSSRYLVPSQLLECDLEELWWLGDTRGRERLPALWPDPAHWADDE